MEMTIALRDRWCGLLRSSRISQGRNALMQHDQTGKVCFCTIGLLAAIVARTQYRVIPEYVDINGFPVYGWGNNNPNVIPVEMCELISTNPLIAGELARLNDEGKTFPELADLIELWVVPTN